MPGAVHILRAKTTGVLSPHETSADAEISYKVGEGWSGGSDGVKTAGVGLALESVALDYGGDRAGAELVGPSAGAELGIKSGLKGTNVAAMVELSLVKVEGEVKLTENIAATGSFNLNWDTGVKIGNEGFKANVFGWGVTFGVGGKWTADTPFGSGGVCAPKLTREVTYASMVLQ